VGSISEMIKDSEKLKDFIRYFGEYNKIFYVHFRDVKGKIPNFTECFLGDGNFNPSEILMELDKAGFGGFLVDDHVPELTNDTVYGHRARSYTIGYMQGLLNFLDFHKNKPMKTN
jgi:mannonate dehydratase